MPVDGNERKGRSCYVPCGTPKIGINVTYRATCRGLPEKMGVGEVGMAPGPGRDVARCRIVAGQEECSDA